MQLISLVQIRARSFSFGCVTGSLSYLQVIGELSKTSPANKLDRESSTCIRSKEPRLLISGRFSQTHPGCPLWARARFPSTTAVAATSLRSTRGRRSRRCTSVTASPRSMRGCWRTRHSCSTPCRRHKACLQWCSLLRPRPLTFLRCLKPKKHH
jgi:hypothetical protein